VSQVGARLSAEVGRTFSGNVNVSLPRVHQPTAWLGVLQLAERDPERPLRASEPIGPFGSTSLAARWADRSSETSCSIPSPTNATTRANSPWGLRSMSTRTDGK